MHAALEPRYDLGQPQPQVLVLRDDWFRLIEPWEYRWRHRETPDGSEVLVRLRFAEGFELDGASIHWAATPFMGGRWALGLYAPIPHDGLYRCAGVLDDAVFGIHPEETDEAKARAGERYMWHEVLRGETWEPVGHDWSRSETDRLFGRQLREAEIARWRRRAAYRAVTWFGEGSWGQYLEDAA